MNPGACPKAPVGEKAPSRANESVATKWAAATTKLAQPTHRGSTSLARTMTPTAADKKTVIVFDTLVIAVNRSHIERAESALRSSTRYAALDTNATAAIARVKVATPMLSTIA